MAGSVAEAAAELKEAARREEYRLRLLNEKLAEREAFKESLKKSNGGA